MFKLFKKQERLDYSFTKTDDYNTIVFIEKLLKDVLKWKILAFAMVFIAIIFVVKGKNKASFGLFSQDFIATIEMDGVIQTDKYRTKILEELSKNNNLKGVLLKINSPGGTITGSEILYDEIKKLSKKVPVYALIYDVGASGGYMIALGATKIFAYETSITGSIGVLMQSIEAAKLAEKLGIKYKIYRSVKYKAQPDPFEETSPEIDEYMQNAINESHKFFENLVMVERKISPDNIKNVANGKVFMGSEALKLHLIDEISNEENVKKKLINDIKNKYGKELDFKEISLKEDENKGFMSQIIDIIFGNDSSSSSKIQIMAIMK